MTDHDIIALYMARNEQAITETDRAYGRLCMDLVLNILGDLSDAEECVNDTWLKVWNAIPPACPPSLRAFVCKIARNIAIDRYRRGKAMRRNSQVTVALEELSPYIAAPPEADIELPHLIEAFLYTEDALDRRLFMGRYWHAYTVNKMATYYGLSPNAVSHRLKRTKERLRDYLKERGYSI